MSGKHISLSAKSLDRISEWQRSNEGHPLAVHYFLLCASVGIFCEEDARDAKTRSALQTICPKWDWYKREKCVSQAQSSAIVARDIFGRLILNALNSGRLK